MNGARRSNLDMALYVPVMSILNRFKRSRSRMRISRFMVAITLGCVTCVGADWLTDGGGPQRNNWQKDEHILNKDNVKNLKILWKIQLDNKPIEMHSLFPPLIVDKVNTPGGPKQIAILAGVSDNIYGIDVATAKILWHKHFEYPEPARRGRATDPLCPAGLTATPIIGPPNAQGNRTVYALAGDGQVHS